MEIKLDKKKRFENPELEIIEFANDDIITESGTFGPQGPQPGDINGGGNGWW